MKWLVPGHPWIAMEYPSKRGAVLTVKVRVKRDLLNNNGVLENVIQEVSQVKGWVIIRFNTEKKPGTYFGWAIVEKVVQAPTHADLREAKKITKILRKHLW